MTVDDAELFALAALVLRDTVMMHASAMQHGQILYDADDEAAAALRRRLELRQVIAPIPLDMRES